VVRAREAAAITRVGGKFPDARIDHVLFSSSSVSLGRGFAGGRARVVSP
jgi:hypothetical protein